MFSIFFPGIQAPPYLEAKGKREGLDFQQNLTLFMFYWYFVIKYMIENIRAYKYRFIILYCSLNKCLELSLWRWGKLKAKLGMDRREGQSVELEEFWDGAPGIYDEKDGEKKRQKIKQISPKRVFYH